MLNFNDLCVLLMILAGPVSGFCAAHAYKAGAAALLLFVLIGLSGGIGFGLVSSKLAYSVLDSKKRNVNMQLLLYMLIPFASLLAVIAVPALLAAMVYG